MTKLAWDSDGDRLFEVGLDRGVLYLTDGSGVAWNGLISADMGSEEGSSSELYFDGVKVFDSVVPGDFIGTINAFTYPDAFLTFEGHTQYVNGLFLDNQPSATFGLSYRTLIGNDVDSTSHGYKIHVVYNIIAEPNEVTNSTLTDNVSPIEFSWSISSTPEAISGRRPTAHFIFDSTKMNPNALAAIEDILYGTDTTEARLPSLLELLNYTAPFIVDNGDGTWTATFPEYLLTMLDANTFQIDDVIGEYLSPDKYRITSL